ncbi:MAG: hypothetical protein ACFFDT_41000 [Candidatus Hodarchaeota archaeon]
MNSDEKLRELGKQVDLSDKEITVIQKNSWYRRNPRIYFLGGGIIAALSYILFVIGYNKTSSDSPASPSDLTSVTTTLTSSDLTSVTTTTTSSDLTSITTTTTSSDLTSVTTTDTQIYPYGILLGSLMVIPFRNNRNFFKIFKLILIFILVVIFSIIIGFAIEGARSPIQDTIEVVNGTIYPNYSYYGVWSV